MRLLEEHFDVGRQFASVQMEFESTCLKNQLHEYILVRPLSYTVNQFDSWFT